MEERLTAQAPQPHEDCVWGGVDMAKLPIRLPRWYLTVYGGNENSWEEAKAQCRRTLRAWAAQRRYGYYGDLA